jgi:hypothetical protein
MSKLQDFLNDSSIEEMVEEVVVSERFKDKDGNYLKFKIANIPMDEYKGIQKLCTKTSKKGTEFDSVAFSEKIVIKGTLDPNFKDAESIKKKGCITPEAYLKKVLKTGEIIKLSEKILVLSGFEDNIEELIEEAKN